MKYYVYIHKCPILDEPRYVGKGSTRNRYRNFKDRSGKHLSWIKSLDKKGLKPIAEIVEYFEKEEDAFDREIELIKYYTDLGIKLKNGTLGGDSGPTMRGDKHPYYGKTLPCVISQKKNIVCLNTDEKFDSITDASKKYNISVSAIVRVCNLRRSKVHGLVFRYIGQENLKFEGTKRLLKKPHMPKHRKKVLLVEKNIEFDKISDAVKYCLEIGIKTNRQSIRNVANGVYKSAGGYIWRFL